MIIFTNKEGEEMAEFSPPECVQEAYLDLLMSYCSDEVIKLYKSYRDPLDD